MLPITLSFEDICVGETFHQSIYATIQKTPPLHLMHQYVHRALKTEPMTPQFPHMSLYYGEGDRKVVLEGMRTSGKITDVEGGGVIVSGTSAIAATEVWLVDTTGPPEEWKTLTIVKLGNLKEGRELGDEDF